MVRVGGHGLRARPVRVVLSALGIAIGIAAMVAVVGISTSSRAELNRLLYTSERAFRHEPGLPRCAWFKHLAYAPGFYTGYGVKTLPAIREGIEEKAWDEARRFIPIVAAAIDKLAGQIDRAQALLSARPVAGRYH